MGNEGLLLFAFALSPSLGEQRLIYIKVNGSLTFRQFVVFKGDICGFSLSLNSFFVSLRVNLQNQQSGVSRRAFILLLNSINFKTTNS